MTEAAACSTSVSPASRTDRSCSRPRCIDALPAVNNRKRAAMTIIEVIAGLMVASLVLAAAIRLLDQSNDHGTRIAAMADSLQIEANAPRLTRELFANAVSFGDSASEFV